MRETHEGRNAPYRIAIASPLDVWCAGMEAIIRQTGKSFAGRWMSCEQAVSDNGMADINLLIVARRLVGLSGHTERFRPLSGRYSGNIVIVIEPDDVFTAEDFVSMDVEGLLLAGAGIDRVSECIDTVCRGGMWLDPDIRGSIGTAQSSPPAHRKLSTREQQVARLAAEGLSNKRIARALQVSDGTVKMHMHHIITKLKLSNRYDLVRLAHCFPAGAAGLNGLKPVPVDAGGQTQAQIIPLRQY